MATEKDLAAKLDALVRLTAIQVVGERTGTEAILELGRAGLSNELIAELVGASSATVRSALSKARRRAVGTSRAPRSKTENGSA